MFIHILSYAAYIHAHGNLFDHLHFILEGVRTCATEIPHIIYTKINRSTHECEAHGHIVKSGPHMENYHTS